MVSVKNSPKSQSVIPKVNKPGRKIADAEKGDTAHLVQAKTLEELQGIAKDANIEGFREKKERF